MTVPAEVIIKTELQLVKIQKAFSVWKDAGLPEKTIIILLSHSTKIPQKTIKKMFEGIDSLYEDYFNNREE